MNSKRSVIVAAVLAAVILMTAQGPAQQSPTQQPPAEKQSPQGQKPPARSLIPDTFTNLQVLPKDISKSNLMRIMKSFSITFEKRCSFCHVATDDLSEADFASDEKETKKKARDLLQFIRETQNKPAATP